MRNRESITGPVTDVRACFNAPELSFATGDLVHRRKEQNADFTALIAVYESILDEN